MWREGAGLFAATVRQFSLGVLTMVPQCTKSVVLFHAKSQRSSTIKALSELKSNHPQNEGFYKPPPDSLSCIRAILRHSTATWKTHGSAPRAKLIELTH